MNDGTGFVAPFRCGIKLNIGFSGARCKLGGSSGFGTRKPPEPPTAGWLWHTLHWSPLNRIPKPEEFVFVTRFACDGSTNVPSVTSLQSSQTPSSCIIRWKPSLNICFSMSVNPLSGAPAPGGPGRTPGSFCAAQTAASANNRKLVPKTGMIFFELSNDIRNNPPTRLHLALGTSQYESHTPTRLAHWRSAGATWD